MPSPTATPPDRPPPWSDPPPPPPPPPPRGTARSRGPRRGAPLAAMLVVSALLGGGASAGILAATGALDGGGTTIVQRSGSTVATGSSDASGSSAGSLDAKALYDATSAGVVDITAKGVTDSSGSPSPFGQPQQSPSTATGTGFFYDGQGHVITAAHVVDGASSVTVTLQDGTTRKATVLGTDDATDVAVLRIDPSGLSIRPLTLGSSAALAEGDALAAIGDPFGYQRSISTGIVSGLDRTIEAPNGFTVAHAIQTDAALNPGNSGGPVLNASGHVVGIVDQIATGSSGSEQSSGVGFAVPIDLVRSELSALERGRPVRHAYMGVATSSSSDAVRGALLSTVASGGPAADAGLRAGDVVTRIGDAAIAGGNDLVAAVAAHRPGDEVRVVASRDGRRITTTVTLATQPATGSTG